MLDVQIFDMLTGSVDDKTQNVTLWMGVVQCGMDVKLLRSRSKGTRFIKDNLQIKDMRMNVL